MILNMLKIFKDEEVPWYFCNSALLLKRDQNQYSRTRNIAFYSQHSSTLSNWVPTLPTVQLNHQHLSWLYIALFTSVVVLLKHVNRL